MNLRFNKKNKRIALICIFFSLFIIGTLLIFTIPISVKETYGLTVYTSDGVVISYDVFEPVGREGELKPAIIIAHGYMANKEIMKGYAIEMAAAGFLAVTFDFRGHGLSSGVIDTSLIINDVNAIKLELLNRNDVDINNFGYLGYSMGGFPGNEIITTDTDFKCFIGVGTSLYTSVRNGTSVNPLNVLMIQARFDEANPMAVLESRVGNRVGLGGPADPNKLYGSFNDGNASMIFLDDNTDHLLLTWDQDFIREARNWVINTFPWISPVDENFYVNIRGLILILQCFGGFGFFFLIIEPLSNKIVKAKEEDKYIIELKELSSKNIIFRTLAFVLGLSLVGMIFMIPLLLFIPLSTLGMMSMLLFGSAFAIFLMFWRISKKTDLSIKNMFKGIVKRRKGQLPREIILGVILFAILYLILYLSIGLNYFAIVPYYIKIFWSIPFYPVFFFLFLTMGLVSNVIIQPRFSNNLKGACKAGLINFMVMTTYYVIYILLMSFISHNYFFLLTFFIAIPLNFLSGFISAELYQKTGNILAGTIINTTLFILIIATLSPFTTGLSMILSLGAIRI